MDSIRNKEEKQRLDADKAKKTSDINSIAPEQASDEEEPIAKRQNKRGRPTSPGKTGPSENKSQKSNISKTKNAKDEKIMGD